MCHDAVGNFYINAGKHLQNFQGRFRVISAFLRHERAAKWQKQHGEVQALHLACIISGYLANQY